MWLRGCCDALLLSLALLHSSSSVHYPPGSQPESLASDTPQPASVNQLREDLDALRSSFWLGARFFGPLSVSGPTDTALFEFEHAAHTSPSVISGSCVEASSSCLVLASSGAHPLPPLVLSLFASLAKWMDNVEPDSAACTEPSPAAPTATQAPPQQSARQARLASVIIIILKT